MTHPGRNLWSDHPVGRLLVPGLVQSFLFPPTISTPNSMPLFEYLFPALFFFCFCFLVIIVTCSTVLTRDQQEFLM